MNNNLIFKTAEMLWDIQSCGQRTVAQTDFYQGATGTESCKTVAIVSTPCAERQAKTSQVHAVDKMGSIIGVMFTRPQDSA